ncbi:Copia protein [Papilio machaon]|uniref:Copia protein n=1 Tax=Papilio machaon TaxID=76193 RepID=A0A194QQ21_PAPMA|nr:Copia protein [Papilio machaon]
MYGSGKEVCRLRKSLYGLKQASRQWNKKLSHTLKGMGLLQNRLDPCIFYKIVDEKNMFFLAVYVDDIIIFTNNLESKTYFKKELQKQFKIKDLGDINYCIGIHVQRDRKNGIIYLDQKKYIQEVLYKYGMSDCKSVKTPMDTNVTFEHDTLDKSSTLSDVPYQEIVGCLLYISQITRPDISFVIGMLSKYNNKPEMSHWIALKRVMRYLKGTEGYKLTYKCNSGENMSHGYCDADWASSEDDRRSCTGYTFLFQGGAISWNSKRQPTVALSTTEAEYMSLSSCIQEALWLKQFQESFWPVLENEPMIIYSDNQSSIKLSGTDGHHPRTKHIDVRHHFIRDKVAAGAIDVQYIQSDMMVADALTKATPYPKLIYCASKMGLIYV